MNNKPSVAFLLGAGASADAGVPVMENLLQRAIVLHDQNNKNLKAALQTFRDWTVWWMAASEIKDRRAET